MRSTTSVLKATTEVRSDGTEASAEPITPAYTADSAMEPDWSMAMTSSRWMAGASRPKPMTCSGTRVRRSGSQWRRLAWMVRFQSMSPGRGRRERRWRRSAPLTAWCSGRASRASISATTVATMRRAVARASSGR